MRIDSIEVFHVALPLRRPLAAKFGPTDSLQTVLVRMTGGSSVGWGEATPGNAPSASPEWAGGVFGCVKDFLAPAVVGRSLDTDDALDELIGLVQGNRFAKAALDTAWWDLKAKAADKPLHVLLGGKRDTVEVGVGFDQMESIEEFCAAIRGAFGAGFSRVELKFRPGWDINMINYVRQEFPVETIHVDVEGDMHLGHMETLCRLDDFSLAMVEQPIAADDMVGNAMVQETIRTPVCLDESITTPAQAEMALDLQAGKFVNVKPGRVGGLTPAVAIHDACHNACVPCYVGAGPQSSIGTRIQMALAAKPNFTYPADWIGPEDLFEQDLAPSPEAVRDESDGVVRVRLWSEPGIGVEPDMDVLKKYCLAKAEILPGD
jgi:o-succinylbenzoate synthase